MTTPLERLAGRRVVASISGGKDSAAMSLHLRELGIEHDRVHLRTQWEWGDGSHEGFVEYLRGPLTEAIGPITEIEGPLSMEALVRKKGMFPSRVRRFCTQELKVFPMQKHLTALMDGGADVVNAVGIRWAESKDRAKFSEWEWQDGFDCEVWRPILAWSMDEVVAIHRRHGLAPNPLYLMGASRVGCWPCIMAKKDEIRLIADKDPGRIDRLRALEAEIEPKARARYSKRLAIYRDGGATALSTRDRQALLDKDGNLRPYRPPTWFQSPLDEEGGACWPIDRVVAWSRTLRGGRVEDKQTELFATADEGCMRWGLCETVVRDGEAP
jgi:3'-phosphoadenosine 5'-phosphosulfate sulfotransferase (PAPS reductase)/FAD synthetase